MCKNICNIWFVHINWLIFGFLSSRHYNMYDYKLAVRALTLWSLHKNLKLNWYSNAVFFHRSLTDSHAYFRYFFLGHERLSNRWRSKHYPKSDAAPWVEKSSTSRAFHTHDTGLSGHLKMLSMSVLSLSGGMVSE